MIIWTNREMDNYTLLFNLSTMPSEEDSFQSGNDLTQVLDNSILQHAVEELKTFIEDWIK